MKVKLNKLAALLLGGVALLAAGCTDYEVDIQKNADAIASANDQIKALQTALDQLKSDHAADIATLNKTITDLEAALKGDIAKLQTEVNKKLDKTEFEAAKKQIEDAIASLSARVKAIEDADFQKQIDALNTKVQKLDEEKASKEELQKAVADLTTLINGEVAKLDERLTNAENAIKTINEETIPEINKQIKALQDKDTEHDQTLAEHANTLKLLSDYVKNLQDLTAGFPEGVTIKEYIDKQDKDLEASLKAYVQKELEKYVTKTEFNELKAEVNGRLDALEGMLDGFANEEGSVKKYIDAEVEKLQEVDKKLDEAIKAVDSDLQAAKAELEALKARVRAVAEAIRSLVFVPENYVDGVEAMVISTFTYNPLTLEGADSKDEIAVADTTTNLITPTVVAKYHVIPSNADLSFMELNDTVKFVVRPSDPFYVTRTEASEDFEVIGFFAGRDSIETDVIRINVDVTGIPATDKHISVVALQLTNKDLKETYTSDYATVFSLPIDSLRIADPLNEEDDDAHYRRAVKGISNTDSDAFISDLAAWTENFDTLSCDVFMYYNEELDLDDIVIAHFLGGTENEPTCQPNVQLFKDMGLTWKFELVENYKLGDSEQFEIDEEHVLTANDGNAQNLMPIVRVYIMDGEDAVEIAYIKIWVKPVDAETSITWDVEKPFDVEDQLIFSCEGDDVFADSVTLYSRVYDVVDMDRAHFDALYAKFVASYTEADTIGTVTYTPTAEDSILVWTVPAEQLWKVASDPTIKEEDRYVEHVVAFVDSVSKAEVVVTLKAKVKAVEAYKVPIDRYIENFWTRGWDPANGKDVDDDIEKDYALYNVANPAVGVTDNELCIFENNINAAFITDDSGVIELGEYKYPDGTTLPAIGEPGLEVSNISYYFCRDMEKVTKIGDIDVKFEVPVGDSLSLYATIEVAPDSTVREKIAYIDNEGEGKTPNLVYLNKESDVAKILLNTMKEVKVIDGKEYPMPGELFIYISAKGIICGDESGEGGFEVNLFWPENAENEDVWVDHFKAKYRQPVYLSDNAADAFIDAVDFGEGGSFINIKELLNPKDWRARPFEPQKDEHFVEIPGQKDGIDYYSNYWEYYGPITVEVDTTNITCNLGPNGKEMKLPVTIIVNAPVMKADLSGEIKDLTKAYREKDGKPVMIEDETTGKMREMTIEEKLDSINDMIDDQTEAGFLTYKNNGTNVTKDYELYIPVKLNYGWGTISKTITVKVYKTTDSFQNS